MAKCLAMRYVCRTCPLTPTIAESKMHPSEKNGQAALDAVMAHLEQNADHEIIQRIVLAEFENG